MGIIKKIDCIEFGLMSPEQILEMSVVKIERPDTYDEDGYPIESGLMDSRLGVVDPSLKCRTCGEKGGECQGHFGHIELARPVIHVGFGDDIHKILRSTCSECGRVLLDDDEIEDFTKRMQDLQEAGESVEELVKEVYKRCKDRRFHRAYWFDSEIEKLSYVKSYDGKCPHCGAEQEDIKIVKPIDIIEVRNQYDENGELITYADGTPKTEDYDLTATEVRDKLQRIPDGDAYVLGVNPEVARPEWMVLTVLPVPPVTARPSITLDTGERSEDDLTHKLVDILRINQRLIENMEAGAPQLIVEDLWKLLQYHVTTYFDNEASGVPPARHRSGRPLKTLAQRLKGKEGRFRSNLSGKRVNFSARTVISPDPNISINEVGVPEMIAKEVTVPTYVNDWNIDDLKEVVLNGPNVHPGANYVKKNINGKELKVRVLEDNRELVAENLEYGDIVMRHLRDGDIVLFNRQPSLHRMSMMAHEVRVLPYKTFRLNLCVCPPYNADFDGDEMNMHVFQTDESRAEAKSLMRVQEHILSPRFGGPIIGAIHDHISGAYLLTREGFTISEDNAYQMIRKCHLLDYPYKSCFTYSTPKKYVNESLQNYKLKLKRKNRDWTGKELFSLVLPHDLNMVYKAEICKRCDDCPFDSVLDDEYVDILKEINAGNLRCNYNDGFVIIKDGQLQYGAIDEAAYGSFSGKILDTIVKEYGPSYAKEFLDRSTDLAIAAITRIGFTTSTNDIQIPEEAIEVIEAHLDKAEQEVDKIIATYEEGLFQPLPGRSVEETLEMSIVQILGEARDTAGAIAEDYLKMGKQSSDETYDHLIAVENHAVVAAKSGARASMLNLAQETACVGQQSVRGGRITRGYLARPLPHFKKHEIGARAKGFVRSSYYGGLDPIEFFFHAMGGREGLVDTAIRTAQSGYMQRRLVNALEDLNVNSEGLVRDNNGQVIQTIFGEEGIDPAKSDFGHVANLDILIDEMRMNGIVKVDRGNAGIKPKPKPNPLKTKLNKLNNLNLYILSKKLLVPEDMILAFESNSLSKKEIIEKLLSEFSESELEGSLKFINQKSSIIKQLDGLDEDIFNLLSNELDLSTNTRFENIHYLISNFENSVIRELIDEINKKYECSSKLDKLDETVFNMLCEELSIPNLSKKEQIDYMTIFYSKSEIKDKLNLIKEKYETISKLKDLDETIFDILCDSLSISELSKEDKIDYLLNNYSRLEIDELIENAETKLEYILKLDDLNDIEFNLLSDILSIPFESKEDKIDYIINNYDADSIERKINESKEKYELYQELDDLDNLTFTLLFNLLSSDEQSSKEESLYLLVSKFSKTEIDKALKMVKRKSEISEKLSGLDDEFFDLVYDDILKSMDVPEITLKEDKISYLINNFAVAEIQDSIDKISRKLECKSYINDLDITVFNLLFDAFNKDKESLKLSKQEKINYLVDNYPPEEIYNEIDNSKDKFELYNELNDFDDFVFNLICEDLSVPDSDSFTKEDKSYYLVSIYSKTEIQKAYDIATDKAECALKLIELDEISFDFICDTLMGDRKEDSKDDKINYLINNIQLSKIYDEMDIAKDKYILFNELMEIDIGVLDILEILLSIKEYPISNVKKDGAVLNELQLVQKESAYQKYKAEKEFATKKEKVYYLISNYPKKAISSTLNDAYKKHECKSKLEELDESTFDILSNILAVPKSLKEDEINHMIYNHPVEYIYDKIEDSKERFSLKTELDNMENIPFRLLIDSLDSTFDDKSDKEDLINLIIYKHSIDKIRNGIFVSNEKNDFYKSLIALDDESFSFVLFNLPVSKDCISKEEKAYNLVSKYEINDIQSKLDTYKELADLQKELRLFSDSLFDLLGHDYEYLNKYSSKEDKINYLLSNCSKSELKDSMINAKEKIMFMNRLSALDPIEFDLLCDILKVPVNVPIIDETKTVSNGTREEKVNYLIWNYSIDEIYKEIPNSKKKYGYYKTLMGFNDELFSFVLFNLPVSKDCISKEDKAYDLVSNYEINEIQFKVNKFNECMVLVMILKSFDDELFGLLSQKYPHLNEYSSKEEKIYCLLSNYSKSELDESINEAKEKIKCKDKLNNLNSTAFDLLCNGLSIPESSKEERINLLISNHPVDIIYNEMTTSFRKLTLIDDLNNLKEDIFEELYSSLSNEEFDAKYDKIYYLVNKFSENEIKDGINNANEKFKCIDKLDGLSDNIFSLLISSLSVPDSSKDKQIEYMIENYSFREIYNEIDISLDKLSFKDDLNDMDEVIFEILINKLSKRLSNSASKKHKSDELNSSKTKEEKVNFLINNYSREELEKEIMSSQRDYAGLNNLDTFSFMRLSNRLYPSHLPNQKDDKIIYLLKNYSYSELNSKAQKFNKSKEFYQYLENLDDKRFALLSNEIRFKNGLNSKDEKIDFIVGNYSFGTIKSKVEKINNGLDDISTKLSDKELLRKVSNSLHVPSHLSDYEKIDYMSSNYSIKEIKDKIKEFDGGFWGRLGGLFGGRSKSSNPKPQPKPSQNKFCTQCGSKLPPDAKFCINCGNKID